jgi:hypothetical protein
MEPLDDATSTGSAFDPPSVITGSVAAAAADPQALGTPLRQQTERYSSTPEHVSRQGFGPNIAVD